MKKLLSLLIALTLIISVFAITAINTPVSGASQYAQTSTPVEGGNILHCMNWSYNTIKANLDDIKNAGYTAVQTSCIQPPKDYNYSWTDMTGQWWKFYQPIDICVADGNTWLGSKEELKALTAAAHEKGIKVISDIVVNHMANNGSDHTKNTGINPTLLNDSTCWHNTGISSSGSSRADMTQHDNGGLPDLNTANTTVQNMVIALLKEAVDCGIDGFRFDAAQNIECPSDSSYASDFWPTVMTAVNNYAENTLFSYGEVYDNAWGGLNDYLKYIGHASEPYSGLDALKGVVSGSASDVADNSYRNSRSASDCVIWVESHDSYFNGTGYDGATSDVSTTNITRAWAITGSRNAATGLFFARPNSTMRLASSDTTWKSTAVAEVNKFKNYFRGQSEYLASSGKVAYNERGTSGVVISKLDGAGAVSLTANKMASGTYTDQISGNTFTVSGGKITGTVGSTGVAVVYNPSNTSQTEATTASSGITLTLNPGVWNADSAWFAAYFYGGGSEATWSKMTGSGSTYTVDAPAGYTNVIFVRMSKEDTYTMSWDNKWNQTADLTIPASNATYTISGWGSDTDVCPGSWSIDPTTAPTSAPTAAPTTAPTTATTATQATSAPTEAPTEAPTSAPAAASYYLVGSMSGWTPNSDYNFISYPSDSGTEQYKLTVYLNSGVTCKAVKAADGTTITDWYPDGMNNDIPITTAGWYSFYLRPNGDGNSDWIASGNDSSKKVIYYKSVAAPATEAPTTAPTAAPTDAPTDAPTAAPTEAPTAAPTDAPTDAPTEPETQTPTTYNHDVYYKLGDVDDDEAVTIMDATKVQMLLAGYEYANADKMRTRGAITGTSLGIMDATAIQRKLAGFTSRYAIGDLKEY